MPSIPLNLQVGPTLGAIFIGALMASIFYGITTLQTIFYFTTYSNDRIGLKALVTILWILDTLDLAFVAHGLYTYFITDFLQPLKLLEMVWTIASEPIIGATVALIVHQFLIYRIWVLDKKLAPLAIVLSIFAVFPWTLASVAVGKFIGGGGRWDTVGNLRWITIAADVSNSVLDLIIAGTTCHLFRRGAKFNVRTERITHWLTIYTISSGLLTSLTSTAGLITYLASPNSFGYQVLNFMLSKAYANAMMASLNARQSIRSIGQSSGTSNMPPNQHLSAFVFARADSNGTSEDGSTTNVALKHLEKVQDGRKTDTSSTIHTAVGVPIS